MSGTNTHKNKHLEKVLEAHGRNTAETWASIVENKGSVQHFDFLSEWEKDVFKTALEIDQIWLVELAADRQEFICQAQSINLFFPANVSKQELHYVHLLAWKKGLKSLYYLRSESERQSDKLSKSTTKHSFDFTKPIDTDQCLACEG